MYCSDYDGTQLSSRWVTGCRTDPPAHGCMEVHLLEIFQRKKKQKSEVFGRNRSRTGAARDLASVGILFLQSTTATGTLVIVVHISDRNRCIMISCQMYSYNLPKLLYIQLWLLYVHSN